MTTTEYVEFGSLVEDRVAEEYLRAGYSKAAADGSEGVDEDKMRTRTFEVVSAAVVTNKSERSKTALTNAELYARVFPLAPGAEPDTAGDLDDVESAVRSHLMRKVWGLTNAGPSGFIQKRLGDQSSSLMVCRANVARNLELTKGVYVTDDPTLIIEDSLNPEVEKLVRAAENLRKHGAMIRARHPELEQRVNVSLASGASRTRATVQLALPSGKSQSSET